MKHCIAGGTKIGLAIFVLSRMRNGIRFLVHFSTIEQSIWERHSVIIRHALCHCTARKLYAHRNNQSTAKILINKKNNYKQSYPGKANAFQRAGFCRSQFLGADVTIQNVIFDINFFLEVFSTVNKTEHVMSITIENLANT